MGKHAAEPLRLRIRVRFPSGQPDSISSLTMKKDLVYGIRFPICAFGNHLRWLLLLSDKFTWAESLESKVEFIMTAPYSKTRSWTNWLDLEQMYRDDFDQYIDVHHYLKSLSKKWDKTIHLIRDPQLCLSFLLTHSRSLNGGSVENFLDDVATANFFSRKIASKEFYKDRALVLDAERLNCELLDKEFYNQCINFFSISDEYDTACYIHKCWYQLRTKAENDFIKFIKEFYP